MKKRKKQGKKKFGVFFRRCFLLTLLAAAVIVWRLLFYAGWENSTHLNPENYMEFSLEYAEEGDNERRVESSLNAIDAGRKSFCPGIPERLAILTESGNVTFTSISERAVMLFQPETGEMIFSSPFAVAVVWQNEERKYYYLRDQSALKQLTELDNLYEPYSVGGDLVYHLYSIYVKDDQFVPGEVFVVKNSFWPPPFLKSRFNQLNGEWVDLSPADLSGWTKICNDHSKEYLSVDHEYDTDVPKDERSASDLAKKLSKDGNPHIGSVTMWGSPNAPRAEALMNRMRSDIPEMMSNYENSLKNQIHQAIYDDYEYIFNLYEWKAKTREELVIRLKDAYKKQCSELPMTIYKRMYSSRIDRIGHYSGIYSEESHYEVPGNYEAGLDEIEFRGQKWQLFHFQYADPNKYFNQMYLAYAPLAILPMLFLSACAALILSVIAYLIYSRRYDIEAYRRNLTGALAHDLKTPLAVIYGHAENIRSHTHPESEDEYADCIMENVTHIDEMIAGVLDLSKLEGRKAPAMKEQIDLTELLHAAFLRNAALTEQRGLTLTESGQLTVKGNADMLAQLAENLAANAVQHTAEGGAITVTAEKRSVRISNPYTGELDAKALCEPFRRGDAARGSQSGSGLGLSIVQQIAALHKLRLRVTAKDGIFTVELKRRRFH